MQIDPFDFLLVVVFCVLIGCAISLGVSVWMEQQKKVATKATKPIKEMTPDVIRHRIVKGQWSLLQKRMDNLTTVKNNRQSTLSSISSVKIERRCVGVISLDVGERGRYGDKGCPYPMPLCVENREKLINLGFKNFSNDGLWVSYVEPLL